MAAFPPVFMLVFGWVMETFMLLMRTLLSFLLALSTIAFLITLSPIFLSFMLFKVTYHFFESWLRYMVSYALQIIIVFAIISLWITSMMLFAPFFKRHVKLIFPYQQVENKGADGHAARFLGSAAAVSRPNAYGPVAVCKPGASGGVFDPNQATNPGFYQADQKKLIAPPRMVQETTFMYYLIYHMVTLILIAYAFNILLKNAPDLARDLVGSGQIPPLGAGFGAAAI